MVFFSGLLRPLLRFRAGGLTVIAASAFLAVACANKGGLSLDGTGTGGSGVLPATSTSAILEAIAGPNSPSAMAAAAAGGSEMQVSGVNLGLLGPQRAPTRLQRIWDELTPVRSAWAASACGVYSTSSSTCQGTGDQLVTIVYADCGFGTSTAVWNGGEILMFGGTAACGSTTLPIVNSGDQLTRTFTGNVSNAPTTRTSSTGVMVELDTTLASGYATSLSGGVVVTGTTAVGASGATGTPSHSIAIHGIHAVSSIFDYTISTPVSLSVENPGSNAVITSGTILVQHNKYAFSGTAVLTNLAFNSSSCLPQSGTITTTYSGTIAGTETLTFTGDGNADYVNSAGINTSVTLTHCF